MSNRVLSFVALAATMVSVSACAIDRETAPTHTMAPGRASADLSGLTSATPLFSQPSEANALYSAASGGITLLADDFTVPVGQTWTVTSLVLSGKVIKGPMLISIRADAGGQPGNVVAGADFNLSASASEPLACCGGIFDFLFDLPTAVVLPAGKYWVAAASSLPDGDLFYWQYGAETNPNSVASPDNGATWFVNVTGIGLSFAVLGESAAVGYHFDGFASPVKNDGTLNVTKAGRTIPLKFRLTDANGAPVTSIGMPTLTVTDLGCSAGTTQNQITETIAGGSGLQNLGNGYFQLNWKVPSAYAGSCKTLRLDIGDGSSAKTALFEFTK